MGQHQYQVLLQLILVMFTGAQFATDTFSCYQCWDLKKDLNDLIDLNAFNDLNGDNNYDENCGDFSYNDIAHLKYNCSICQVKIYEDSVERLCWNGEYGVTEHYDGECQIGITHSGPAFSQQYTACWCEGDFCNTNNYCSHCGSPKTTPSPSAATTTTPSPSSTITTASSLGSLNNPDSPIVSLEPGKGLQCYSCLNCDDVNDSTPVIQNDFQTCEITILKDSGIINRGGSNVHLSEVGCEDFGDIAICHCSGDLCNDRQK